MSPIEQATTDDPIEDSVALQDAVSALGFDWPNVEGVIDKVEEEVSELRGAIDERNNQDILHEFGDVLFALVNLGRFCDITFEKSLSTANQRFRDRFARMQTLLHENNQTVETSSFDELNAAWDRAKGMV